MSEVESPSGLEVGRNAMLAERTVVFDCEGDSLVGVLSEPLSIATRGVLIVVGGPQYRVGSHRQFTLLARHLAQAGVPTLRFDYRGMGDSSGSMRTFEQIGTDIRCAVDSFFTLLPGLKDIVIWGLCDAASAALFYAHTDARVSGLVLLNPWVRTVEGEARAYLRHYYLARLLSAAFWRKLVGGKVEMGSLAASLKDNLRLALRRKHDEKRASASLPERMADGLARFNGRLLLILSGSDLTAKEFMDVSASSEEWRSLLASARVTRHVIPDATHTFSRRAWRAQVEAWTAEWLQSW